MSSPVLVTPPPPPTAQHEAADNRPGGVGRRRSSTLLDPREHVHKELWASAPVLKGTTKFSPRKDAKNIMITGGAGFIACWFVRHLTLTYPEHYNIVSFDKLDYCASLNNTRILDTHPNYTFVQGDITSTADVKHCLRAHSIDTVIHFAAQSHVDLSFGNSYQFTSTNVYGTHVLLESARAHCIKRFIHISTDEVYGDVSPDGDPLIESSLLAPTNPYAASKAAAEMLVNAYWKSFQLPVVIIRSNNAYGPHQFPEKIIPKFTMLLHRGQKLLLHGDGSPTRRYLYVGDLVDALDTIFHRGALGQIYNVSSRDEISNLEICRKLLRSFGLLNPQQPPPPPPSSSSSSPPPPSSATLSATTNEATTLSSWIQYTDDRPFNDQRYATDGSKLAHLGWSQRTPIDEGLRLTVQWYRQFGEVWWGDISRILTAFPVARGNQIFTREEHEHAIVEEEGEPQDQQQRSQRARRTQGAAESAPGYLRGAAMPIRDEGQPVSSAANERPA